MEEVDTLKREVEFLKDLLFYTHDKLVNANVGCINVAQWELYVEFKHGRKVELKR